MRFGAWLLSSAFAATAAHADGAVAGATPGGSEIVVTATRSARLIKDVFRRMTEPHEAFTPHVASDGEDGANESTPPSGLELPRPGFRASSSELR